MLLHIVVKQLRGWPIISCLLIIMLFYSLYYDIISLKITQAFHLLLGFAENLIVFWDFKFESVRITEGSDNRDSDNLGPTVHAKIHTRYVWSS